MDNKPTDQQALARWLFLNDPELKEALEEWYNCGTWNDLGDRLAYLKSRAVGKSVQGRKSE